jgi:uncharacterized lipoprotein YajG
MTLAGKTLRVLAVASSVTLLAGYVAISQSTSRTPEDESPQKILISGSKALSQPVFDTRTLQGVDYYVFRPVSIDLMSSSKGAILRPDVLARFRFKGFGIQVTANKP